MNLDDRLRRELHEQSGHIDPAGVGADAVMAGARARTRRTRIAGSAVVGLFLVAVAGAAVLLRDDPGESSTATARFGDASDSAIDGEEISAEAPAPSNDGSAAAGAATEPSNAAAEAPATEDQEGASDASDAGASADQPDDSEGAADGSGDAATNQEAPPPAARAAASEIIRHRNGFVALDGSGSNASLAFSTNGNRWAAVPDPKPTRRSTITQIASYDGVLYVAGDRPRSGSTRPWAATTRDLESWTELDIPTPPADSSDLTSTFTRVYSLAAGPAGVLVTGETIVDLQIDELVGPEVLESGSWSLGDSTGDLTTVTVFDEDGAVTREIDLIAEGVSPATIERWSAGNPIPYVAVAPLGGQLQTAEVDLDPGTLLVDAVVTTDGFTAAGFSEQFSSRIVWSSSDGQVWTGHPVGVVANEQAEEIGIIGGRLNAFASQGPVFTVQQQRGDEWRESRLDPLFGNPNDDYLLVDSAFDETGVVAIVATVGQSEGRTLWLASSDNGRSWEVEALTSALGTSGAIGDVHSVAIDPNAVLVSYTASSGRDQLAVLSR